MDIYDIFFYWEIRKPHDDSFPLRAYNTEFLPKLPSKLNILFTRKGQELKLL